MAPGSQKNPFLILLSLVVSLMAVPVMNATADGITKVRIRTIRYNFTSEICEIFLRLLAKVPFGINPDHP